MVGVCRHVGTFFLGGPCALTNACAGWRRDNAMCLACRGAILAHDAHSGLCRRLQATERVRLLLAADEGLSERRSPPEVEVRLLVVKTKDGANLLFLFFLVLKTTMFGVTRARYNGYIESGSYADGS